MTKYDLIQTIPTRIPGCKEVLGRKRTSQASWNRGAGGRQIKHIKSPAQDSGPESVAVFVAVSFPSSTSWPGLRASGLFVAKRVVAVLGTHNYLPSAIWPEIRTQDYCHLRYARAIDGGQE